MQTTIIAQNGQVGYLAAMHVGYYYIIDYDITTTTPTLRGVFDNGGILITPDRMEVTDQHLFLYSQMSTTVHYYSLTTRMRLGTFTLADSAREMRYLPSRNQIMFVENTTGLIRFFPLNNLPPTNATIGNVNSSPLLYPIIFSVSPNENYISVGTNETRFKIFNLNTMT
jgi:hypothetical protein